MTLEMTIFIHTIHFSSASKTLGINVLALATNISLETSISSLSISWLSIPSLDPINHVA